MKIRSIELENIRSHVRSLVDLSDGFSCLVGGLGTGKSSILYAIDFALFGEPMGRSYDYLLREGADTGRILLRFVKNGREYTIERAFKRQAERISQDMEQLKLLEGEKLIADMKGEAVAEQLRSVTGIDKDIFRELIWVRQEHLKDVLNIPSSQRQRRLDQLFGLSDYETSWSNLRSILRWYESEKSSLERDPDIVGIKDAEARYSEAAKDLVARESELEAVKIQLAEAEKGLSEASARLQELEEISRRNDQLQRETSRLEARMAGLDESLRRLLEETENRRARIAELEARLESLRSQEAAQRQDLRQAGLPLRLTVPQLLQHAETLLEQISGNLGREESLKNDMARSTQRITNLVKENTCPLCLQALDPEYKDSLMNRLYQETSDSKQRLAELEETTEEFERMRNVVNTVVSRIQTMRTRIEEISRQRESEASLLSASRKRIEEEREERKMLEGQLAGARFRMAEFDVTELDRAQRLRISAFERYSDLKHRTQSIESQEIEILKRLETLKERLDTAHRKMERLEKVGTIVEHAQEIRQAYRSIQPKLRAEFVAYLERVVQQVLDELTGAEGPMIAVKIDEDYTPIVEGEG
ncbi:MAG: AAA family ATPase, partial [Candidatus Bathyarchaeota archaeon]|nr:AAA family ATPase [Candidatus Bathyarchaeota archaeon]